MCVQPTTGAAKTEDSSSSILPTDRFPKIYSSQSQNTLRITVRWSWWTRAYIYYVAYDSAVVVNKEVLYYTRARYHVCLCVVVVKKEVLRTRFRRLRRHRTKKRDLRLRFRGHGLTAAVATVIFCCPPATKKRRENRTTTKQTEKGGERAGCVVIRASDFCFPTETFLFRLLGLLLTLLLLLLYVLRCSIRVSEYCWGYTFIIIKRDEDRSSTNVCGKNSFWRHLPPHNT